MTQEEKQLLLKDLCARLPYGIKCKLSADGVSLVEDLQLAGLSQFLYGRLDVIPYLRSMSSMTKEERRFLLKFGAIGMDENDKVFDVYPYGLKRTVPVIDFLYEHHLDFRGLIPMGLALEAPEEMYNIE